MMHTLGTEFRLWSNWGDTILHTVLKTAGCGDLVQCPPLPFHPDMGTTGEHGA